MKSKELTSKEAIKKIRTFDKVGDLRKFVAGETRKSVLDVVDDKAIKIKSTPTSKKKETTTVKKDTPNR